MSHPEHPDCPFCVDNGKLKVLTETNLWSLAQAKIGDRPLDGAYLAVPNMHITRFSELPAMWGEYLQDLCVLASELLQIDNLSANLTKEGGRTTEHFHFWILETQPQHQPLGLYTARVELLGAMMQLSQAELREGRLKRENDSLITELAAAYEKIRQLESETAHVAVIHDSRIVVQPGAVQRTAPALAEMGGTH